MLRRFRVDIEGGEVAGVAFGEPAAPLEVLFVHANGFNAITYQSILQPLGGVSHVAAMDLRGHGRTQLPAEPSKLRNWNIFRDDIIQVIEKMAPDGLILAGHSMGATTALLAAAKAPELVKGLVLTDPVLLPPQAYTSAHVPVFGHMGSSNTKIAKGARKRKAMFESPEAAEEMLRGRGAFATWRAPFLHDYLVDGLQRQQEGEYTLSCSPEWESACFAAQANRPWSAIRKLKKQRFPVIILQAERDSTSVSDTDERVHAVRPDAAVTRVPGTTHFLPMERPYVVRDAINILRETATGNASGIDYVGAVKRTINDSIGGMS